MLIRFSLQNFMSFKLSATLNMECSQNKELEETNTFEEGPYKLLKSAVIYGANASGKSNLLHGMGFMKDLILNSSKEKNSIDKIDVEPFLLNSSSENSPSVFEIEFLIQNTKYRYGFRVDKDKIHDEWLYYLPYNKRKEIPLFAREGEKIEIYSDIYKEGKGLEEKTRNNALFLSVAANFNGKISQEIQMWFKGFNLLSGMSNNSIGYTAQMIKNPKHKLKILNLLSAADIGIVDLFVEDVDIKSLIIPKDVPKQILEELKSVQTLFSKHKKYDDEGNEIGSEMFDVGELESEGTKKFLALLGPILDKLENGGVLIVDELDAKMHPLMTKKIVELFNSYDINQSNAQLIFASHDVTNLSNKTFRRDQIWFVKKDNYGSSDMYAISDFKDDDNKKIRKDASYAKDYLLGKYGGTPEFKSWGKALDINNEEA